MLSASSGASHSVQCLDQKKTLNILGTCSQTLYPGVYDYLHEESIAVIKK